jgi:hypothetical protein
MKTLGLLVCLALVAFSGLGASQSQQQTAVPGGSPEANDYKDVQKAASGIVAAVQKAHFQKLLVADFLDEKGTRTDRGVYLAARFAHEIAQQSSGFVVLDRQKWFSLLEAKSATPADAERPEGLRRVCAALGCDGVVSGSENLSDGKFTILASLWEVSTGSELARAKFEQDPTPDFEGIFPAVADPSGIRYYFPGLDGMSKPKCKSCPNPKFGDEGHLHRVQGSLTLSVLVGTDGVPLQVKLMNPVEPTEDSIAVEQVKRWQYAPCRDAAGEPVAVRLSVDVHYHFR